MSDQLVQAFSDLNEELALKLIQERLDAGGDPLDILAACRDGMVDVGKRYEAKEYYVSELMMAGEVFRQASELLTTALDGQITGDKGVVIVGTVQGDIHDIGKDLVVSMLRASGYDVHDLGVDVPPQKFVEELKATSAKVIGLSGLITVSYDGMKDTVNAIKAAGLRDQVTVLIGGGIVNDEVVKYAGADAWGKDAADAVMLFDKYAQN